MGYVGSLHQQWVSNAVAFAALNAYKDNTHYVTSQPRSTYLVVPAPEAS